MDDPGRTTKGQWTAIEAEPWLGPQRLSRGEVIDLISAASKNSANFDIQFAERVMSAMLSASSTAPQAPTDAELERSTGEPHVEGWPLYSGLPPQASHTPAEINESVSHKNESGQAQAAEAEFNPRPFAWARWGAPGQVTDIVQGEARPVGEGWFSVHARFDDVPPLPSPAEGDAADRRGTAEALFAFLDCVKDVGCTTHHQDGSETPNKRLMNRLHAELGDLLYGKTNVQTKGMTLVPVEPTPGLLMSMAIRYDHGLGMPGYYDGLREHLPDDHPMKSVTHVQRLESVLQQMRQLYEEVVGSGFYRPEREADYAAQAPAPAPQLPEGWRLAKVSDGDIRVYGPDKETWLIRKDSGEGFYDFIHRFFDALASQAPAVQHGKEQP